MVSRDILKRAAVAGLGLLALFLAMPLLVDAWAERFMHASVAETPPAETAIVLGASVAHGEPSPILAARAQLAVELYLSGAVRTILVTGDNGALSHDEVTPVRKYLVAAGVPPHAIFLDHAGFDTYSSMYRARTVFGAERVIIISQAFHLPRALLIARTLGLDGEGSMAGGPSPWFDYLREIPAMWKALFDLTVGRTPKYLGPLVPLTGDGQATWY